MQFSKQNSLGNEKKKKKKNSDGNSTGAGNGQSKTNIFSRRRNSLVKDGKLWRSKS